VRRAPARRHGVRQLPRCFELTATRATGADELRVAETANSLGAMLLAARPEIAAGKPQEYGGPPGAGTLALQGPSPCRV
jgi:hypothetical protein